MSSAKNSTAQVFARLFHKCINMAQTNMHRELLEAQQQAITSFIESAEKEISMNSKLVQSILEQASCGCFKISAVAGGESNS